MGKQGKGNNSHNQKQHVHHHNHNRHETHETHETHKTHEHYVHSNHHNHGMHEGHVHRIKVEHTHQHGNHEGHGGGHSGHHEHMLEDFKKRFWVSLVLAIPISYLSHMIQMLFGYEINFTGDTLLIFLLSTIVFFYGGKPFLFGAWNEIKDRTPGMMLLM